ncbi:MAG: hypothetical protein AWU58_321 [Methanohalophilus sp. T328-1]|uniref:hypothetical protein n=1 Tax=Methanohalophilus sp. DAL1 TaxID=1864608 RepID=UPI0007974950|nr:hypothetical protein [Methanohalophilus sp. DAL1]KXS46717.1 MAG: hypothetical protein AWU58_321 [Methanohalophilus sp. T328-1]OBZ35691.1 MAG: hypothetical protein A9957_06535 [Methanohalophilus sp. DAL1]
MSDIIEHFIKRTVKFQIVEQLNENEEMRFGEIKKALGNKSGNIINRELKTLMETEPPLIIKSENKTYFLNAEHPDLEKLLLSLRMIPENIETFPTVVFEDDENPNLGFGLYVTTEETDGFEDDLKRLFEDEDICLAIEEIYRRILQQKIWRVLENKLASGDIEKDEIKITKEGGILPGSSERVHKILQETLEGMLDIHIVSHKTMSSKKQN